MGLVHDPLAIGKKLRILAVADIASEYSPIVELRSSYRVDDVEQALERTCAKTLLDVFR